MGATIADETKLPLWAQHELCTLRLLVAKLQARQAWLLSGDEPRYTLPRAANARTGPRQEPPTVGSDPPR